jgi:hypothetical protein
MSRVTDPNATLQASWPRVVKLRVRVSVHFLTPFPTFHCTPCGPLFRDTCHLTVPGLLIAESCQSVAWIQVILH